MTPIPDHPDIARTLRTGYPHPIRYIRCTCCDRIMTADQTVYRMDAEDLCAGCFVEAILDNHSADEFAQILDVRSCPVAAVLEERCDA